MLHLKLNESLHGQEGLMKEQQALQAQLTKALQLHVKPKTSVDTATIADKIVNIFDEMIQVPFCS